MRDLAVMIAMLCLLPLCLRGRAVAYVVWGWTGLVALNEYVYGFMRSVPFNMIFAILTLLLIFFGKDNKASSQILFGRTSFLCACLGLQVTVSAIFAYPGNPLNWVLYEQFMKVLLFCLLMPLVINSRMRIHVMLLVVALGLAFHGLVEGAKWFVSGGGHRVVGLTKFGDNNHFAVIMVMVIPVLIYLARYAKNRWMRLAFIGGAVLTMAAVMGTNSRGGFLAMALAGGWLVLSGRRKGVGLVAISTALALAVVFAPASWTDRMNTLKTVEEDHSFMNRVTVWKASSEVALRNPLTGGGIHAIQSALVWDQFKGTDGLLGFIDTPIPEPWPRAAHSIYFEMLGDLGFVGFFIFIAILANVFITRREIKRLAREQGGRALWAADLADTLAASMFAYVVGAAALSLGYFEVAYVFVMLMELVKLQLIRQANIAVDEKLLVSA